MKFTSLKSIHFHFETPIKHMLVFAQRALGKNLIWQKSSAIGESYFKIGTQSMPTKLCKIYSPSDLLSSSNLLQGSQFHLHICSVERFFR